MCNAIEMLKPRRSERSIEQRFKKVWNSLDANRAKARALGDLCRCTAKNEEALNRETPWGLAAIFDNIANELCDLLDEVTNLRDNIKKASSEQPETEPEEA